MRTVITVLLCLALSAPLLSCTRTPKVEHSNTITVAQLSDAKRLLPLMASDSASSSISELVFNGLVKYDRNIKLTGDLAESWDINNDGLEVIFHLRQGVLWHDGEEFTSQDVVYTYQVVTDPNTPTAYGSIYGPVKNVEAVDKYTVRVEYAQPFAPAIESWSMGILPRHLLIDKDVSSDEFNRNPMGTGPYRFKEWVTGQKIVLEANAQYFEGKPNIDTYIMRVIPDPATMFLELKSGGIDFMGLTPTQYKLNSEKEEFIKYNAVYRYPSFGFTYMGYNFKHEFFQDKRVRRALTHAIDKQSIIKGVLLGYGTPCTGPFPPASWAFNPAVNDPEYDPQKALALLREVGWERDAEGRLMKDGRQFAFTLITNQGNELRSKTAEIIKEQLRAVGIDMEIRILEWQAMLNEYVDKRRFEAVLMGWSLSRDPDLYDIWHSSKTGEKEFNFISYANPRVDVLIEEGRTTFDYDRRKGIYNEIHAILAEEQPYTFLFVPDALPALHRRFKGVEQAPAGIWYDFIHWYVPQDKTTWYQQ